MRRRALAFILLTLACRGKEKEQEPAAERPPDAAPVVRAPPLADAAPPPMSSEDTWHAGNAAYGAGDHAHAAQLFDRACEERHPIACEDRAALHEKGEGGPPDMARSRELRKSALRYYQEQCTAGAPDSCKQLSWWLGTGGYAWDKRLLPGNRTRAVELYTRAADLYLAACERGEGASCLDLDAWIVEGLSFGFAKYAKRVATGLRRLHSKDSLVRRACDAGHSIGCYMLGQSTTPLAEKISLFRKSCDAGYHGGCQVLGTSLEDGRGVARDQPQALRFYLRGCELDVGVCFDACRLGDELRTAQPAACKKACEAGFWPSACDMGK